MKAGVRILERILALALGGALSVAASSPPRAESLSSRTMNPLMAASFDAGEKHIVSYFRAGDEQCKLTLTIGGTLAGEEREPSMRTVRLRVTVDAGNTARFDTSENKPLLFACKAGDCPPPLAHGPGAKSLYFTCEAGARAMTARVVERVARLAADSTTE